MIALQKLRENQFLRHNAVFFFGSVAVGGLNYLYYPVLGRLLEPATFGEVQTIISLFLQLTIFLTVLSLVIVNIVINTRDAGQRDRLVAEFEKLSLFVAGIALLASLVLGPQLQRFFQFESAWPFALLALSIVVSVPFMLRGAVLRGQRRFGTVSIGNLIGAGAKIIFSAAFVALGLGTAGAIGGLVVAQLIACGFIAWQAYKLGFGKSNERRFRLPDLRLLLPELRYGAIVFIASLAIILQYSIDIIVIKHYFDAHTAGLYAGVAAVARIIFFLTASFAQVLISSVSMDAVHAKQNHALLVRSLILLAALGLPALLVMIIVPGAVMGILMGNQYRELASLLPNLGIAIFIVSVINLLASYFLALRRFGVAAAALLGLISTYVLILWRHQTPQEVVDNLLIGSLAMLGFLAVWVLAYKAKGGTLWLVKN